MFCSLRRLLEVATYGSKRFLDGDVNVLGEFLGAVKAAVIVVVASLDAVVAAVNSGGVTGEL